MTLRWLRALIACDFRSKIPDIGLVNFTSMCRVEENDIGNGKYTSTSMLYYWG